MLGVIGLFPSYSGSSLASQAANLWPHLIYLAGWAAGAVLIFRGGARQRTGALIATGLSVVTLGLFLADVGFPIADGASLLGAGLVLSLIGWAACAAGSVVAFGRWPADWPRRPLGPDTGVIAALIVAAIGVAVTFAPAWDKITLPTGTGGHPVRDARQRLQQSRPRSSSATSWSWSAWSPSSRSRSPGGPPGWAGR